MKNVRRGIKELNPPSLPPQLDGDPATFSLSGQSSVEICAEWYQVVSVEGTRLLLSLLDSIHSHFCSPLVHWDTHLFLRSLCSSWDNVMMFVFIHHAQDTHRRLVSATKSLQQLVMLSTDLLPHLTSSFDQFVLHQGRIVIMWLQVALAVISQTHQARLLSPVLAWCAKITQDISILCLRPGLSTTGRATRFLQTAIPV